MTNSTLKRKAATLRGSNVCKKRRSNNPDDKITVNVRVGTWNIYYGDSDNLAVPKVKDRIKSAVGFMDSENIDLLALQEIPTKYTDNSDDSRWLDSIAPQGYTIIKVPRENPKSQTRNLSYLIFYKNNLLSVNNDWDYYQQENFETNNRRPPVAINFTHKNNPFSFSFLTWHAEATQAIVRDDVDMVYQELSQNHDDNWILAGDLNIKFNSLPDELGDTEQHLAHQGEVLDHILSSSSGTIEAIDIPGNLQAQLTSDSYHLALFGTVTFTIES